jgi:hypothetical protein
MGYHYNWLERRWDPIDHGRVLLENEEADITRQQRLLDDVITEIKQSYDSVIKLYGGLFVRALAASDELLLRSHSKRIAALGGEDQEGGPEEQQMKVHKRNDK